MKINLKEGQKVLDKAGNLYIIEKGDTLMEASVSSSVFNKINKELHAIGLEYYKEIPLQYIFDLFIDEGITPIQEDKTPWSGMLVGKEGRDFIELMYNGEVLKRVLNISWYKMPSGNYEIVAYV